MCVSVNDVELDKPKAVSKTDWGGCSANTGVHSHGECQLVCECKRRRYAGNWI